jgi:BclB C-terminal domain-containing protein
VTSTGGYIPQSVPQNETITSMTAYFSTTTALALVGTTVTLMAQLYESTTPDNAFTPVPGAVVVFAPSLTGIVSVGTVSNGIVTGLSIPVPAQARLMTVITASASGIALVNIINGFGSVGISASA